MIKLPAYNKLAVEGTYFDEKTCRACLEKKLSHFLSLGCMPKPNGFLTKKALLKPEPYYPLDAAYCKNCGHVQTIQIVDSKTMFENYVYVTAGAKPMLDHMEETAKELVTRFKLNNKSLVIDLGSNDGSFLQYFKKNKVKVLGIDPAKNLAEEAERNGIETIADLFTQSLAQKVVEKKGKADLITAFNVIAHIPTWFDLFAGISDLLTTKGVMVIEFPYVLEMLKKNEFDTIYHEHFSYIGINAMNVALKKHGLEIFDVQFFTIHGGSARVLISHTNAYPIEKAVKTTSAKEKRAKLTEAATYKNFQVATKKVKKDLLTLLKKLKKENKTVIGYGACAKGNVLLNYCGITSELLPAIVDSTPLKHGLYTPGTHIPIYSEAELSTLKPDYVLILAWNFAETILKKCEPLKKDGVKFIIPIPKVHFVK